MEEESSLEQCLSDCCQESSSSLCSNSRKTEEHEGNNVDFDDGCCICLDLLVAPVQLVCNHVFCQHCIAEWCLSRGLDEFCCPQCKSQKHTALTIHELQSTVSSKHEAVLKPVHSAHVLFPAHRELSDSQLKKYGDRYNRRLQETYQSRTGALDKVSWQLQRYGLHRHRRRMPFTHARRKFKYLVILQILIFAAIVLFSIYSNSSPNASNHPPSSPSSPIIEIQNQDEIMTTVGIASTVNDKDNVDLITMPPSDMCPNPMVKGLHVWRIFQSQASLKQCSMLVSSEKDPLVLGLCAVFSETTGVSVDWCYDQAGQVERAISDGLRKEQQIWTDLPRTLIEDLPEYAKQQRREDSKGVSNSDDPMPPVTPLIFLFRRMFISSPLLNLIIELFHYFTE